MYNYKNEIKNDIIEAIKEYAYTNKELAEKIEDRYTWADDLNDDLWAEDSVTGNGSGFYAGSYESMEYVMGNLDLLRDAVAEFRETEKVGEWFLNEDWQSMDVTIRCYLLAECIDEVIDEIEEDGPECIQ